MKFFRELAESDAKRIKLEIDKREMQQKIISLEEELKTLKEDPVRILTSSECTSNI